METRTFPTEAEEAVEHFGQESAFPAPVAPGTNRRILVLVRGERVRRTFPGAPALARINGFSGEKKMNTTRKEFLRSAGAILGGLALGGGTGTAAAAAAGGSSTYTQAPVVGSRRVNADFTGPKAKVFFSKTIDAEHLIRLYGLVNGSISGKVAIKLHT